ncbi:MAG: hypothetical protein U0838_16720 [Chloroflexota bacterium]
MTHAATFETTLAAGSAAGRQVMVHEYGASCLQFDPSGSAARPAALVVARPRCAASSRGAGPTPSRPRSAGRPTSGARTETQFGVTDWTGELRPRGRVLAELAATVRRLDLDGLAGFGPAANAVVPVPHEFAHPYDAAAYGLADAPSGDYVPAEAAWNPERDALPLIAGLLNAFVLGVRADLAPAFPRERLDGAWPDTRLVLLPAPLASTSNSLHHVRTAFWSGAEDHLARGGTVYVACSADVAIPEMAAILGARVVDRAPAASPAVLRFTAPWGPFGAGEVLPLPAGDGTLATRSAVLRAADGSQVVAVDANGDPALVVARRGAGHAVVLAHPLELLLARTPDAHRPDDRAWGVYAGLAALAGVKLPVRAGHPDVTTGVLTGPSGGLATLTNHAPQPVRLRVAVPAEARRATEVRPDAEADLPIDDGAVAIDLEGYGATIVTWRHDA